MSNSLVDKKDNKFIKKSNVIVRAVTNQSAGIMTQRLFNFLIKTVQEEKTEKNMLIMECDKFCPNKVIKDLSCNFKVGNYKYSLETTDNDSVKEIINKISWKEKMIIIIEKTKNKFNSDEINSIDLQNQPSTSGYKPSLPKM